MTRDVQHDLRAADPVPGGARYPEQRIRAEVAGILAGAGVAPPRPAAHDDGDRAHDVIDIAAPPTARRRGGRTWAVSAAAAAVVVAAVVGAVLTGGGDDGRDAGQVAGGGGVAVSCAVRPAGHAATAQQLRSAEQIVTHRVSALGGTVTATRAYADHISFTARDVDRRAVLTVCLAAPPTVRPLVTHAVTQRATGPRSSTPLASLDFTVPHDEAGYATLTAAHRRALQTAMARYDCSGAAGSARDGATLGCGVASDTGVTGASGPLREVYLLAPAVVSKDGFARAVATPPSAGRGGSAEWTVDATLTRSAQQAFGAYTAAHNVGGAAPSADATTCAPSSVPCADFLAYSSGSDVQSAAVTLAAVDGGDVQLSGGYTETTARALADDITAAVIGLPATR